MLSFSFLLVFHSTFSLLLSAMTYISVAVCFMHQISTFQLVNKQVGKFLGEKISFIYYFYPGVTLLFQPTCNLILLMLGNFFTGNRNCYKQEIAIMKPVYKISIPYCGWAMMVLLFPCMFEPYHRSTCLSLLRWKI